MALPYTITNGNVPDAEEVQGNFDFLYALTGSILGGTYAALRVKAAEAPTSAFLGNATDAELLVFYCGNVARGDGGFFTILSYGEIS